MMVYFYLAIFLFCLGLIGVFVKRELLSIFVCFQLMVASLCLLLILSSKVVGNLDGQVMALFIFIIAMIDIAFGLSLSVSLFKKTGTSNIDEIDDIEVIGD